MRIIDKIHLEYIGETSTGGNSAKEYNVELIEDETGYAVTFSYGRISGPLTMGTKDCDLDLDTAREVYTKLVNSKIKKGYEIA